MADPDGSVSSDVEAGNGKGNSRVIPFSGRTRGQYLTGARAGVLVVSGEGIQSDPLIPRPESTAGAREALASPSPAIPDTEAVIAAAVGVAVCAAPKGISMSDRLDYHHEDIADREDERLARAECDQMGWTRQERDSYRHEDRKIACDYDYPIELVARARAICQDIYPGHTEEDVESLAGDLVRAREEGVLLKVSERVAFTHGAAESTDTIREMILNHDWQGLGSMVRVGAEELVEHLTERVPPRGVEQGGYPHRTDAAGARIAGGHPVEANELPLVDLGQGVKRRTFGGEG